MQYELIRAKRRTVALQMTDNGSLIVRAPMRMPQLFIETFIRQKADWIDKARRQVITRAPRKRLLEPGNALLFMGNEYEIKHHNNASKIILRDAVYVPPLSESKLKILVTHWYKEQAKKVIFARVKHYAELMNIEFSQIKLSDAKTRWGSCSHLGNLNFNWRLIMAPQAVLDYVVVHELAHRQEMNHSKAFWQLVEQITPDYKTHRQWIKQNGHLLSI